jgi:hypothetical protein
VFLPDDAAAMTHYSFQLQQIRNGTTVTTNIRGALINSMAFGFALDQVVTMTISGMFIEECKAGGTFADTTSSPAAITLVAPTMLAPFKHGQITLQYGGSVSKDGTTKVYAYTPGTTLNISAATITIDNGLTQREVLSSLYPTAIVPGDRSVTASFTVPNDTPALTFYDLLKADTSQVIRVLASSATIESSFTYQFEVTLPVFSYNDAPYGEISGVNGQRDIEVSGVALVSATTGEEIAVRLRNANNTGY